MLQLLLLLVASLRAIEILAVPAKLGCGWVNPNSEYMGETLESTDRSVVIKRGETEVIDGIYVPGETLTYTLSGLTTGQWLVDTKNLGDWHNFASITGGICMGAFRDTNKQSGTISMPSNGIVEIQLSWATGYGHLYINSMELTTGTPTTASPVSE